MCVLKRITVVSALQLYFVWLGVFGIHTLQHSETRSFAVFILTKINLNVFSGSFVIGRIPYKQSWRHLDYVITFAVNWHILRSLVLQKLNLFFMPCFFSLFVCAWQTFTNNFNIWLWRCCKIWVQILLRIRFRHIK